MVLWNMRSIDRLTSATKVSPCNAASPVNLQLTQGNVVTSAKPLGLSRTTSFPFPTVNSAHTEDRLDNKKPVRTLLCGKNKRAAYNPRPWQQDIDAEDGSPTKAPKMTSKSWPECSTDSTVPNPNSQLNSVKPTDSSSNVLPSDRPGWWRPGGGPPSTNPTRRLTTARNFDFPDSDSDGDAADMRIRHLQQSSIKSTVDVARMPKLSRLIGTPSQDVPVLSKTSRVVSSSSNCLTTGVTTDNNLRESSTGITESDREYNEDEDENEEDDEEEEEDVKPWFRPASRDAADGRQTKTDLSNNRVSRTQKPLYTVIQKVKEAHVCQERGETQHLLDDVEYLVDGLADHNHTNTRALSVLTLANKCLTASFRYMVSAHGLIKRICANLHDAHKDYTLALTSAGLFFILSRDRDPNVFDAESLPVMLKLLSAPDTICLSLHSAMASTTNGHHSCLSRTNKEAERVRTRVRQLLDGLQHQNNNRQSGTSSVSSGTTLGGTGSPSSANGALSIGVKRPVSRIPSTTLSTASTLAPSARLTGSVAGLNTRHLQMTRQLTTADLVLESILNLGTRKAADWFKAELRHGGGLDRVADAAADAVDYLADLDPDQEDDRGRRCRLPKSVWRSYSNPTGLDSFALDKLRRVCHYTKLLENMTYMNSDNQTYLVRYRDRLLVNRLLRCVRLCASHLPKQPVLLTPSTSNPASISSQTTSSTTTKTASSKTGVNVTPTTANTTTAVNKNTLLGPQSPPNDQSILVDCVLGIFRFLVNVSHNEFASDRLGGCPGLLETTLQCLLSLPRRLPDNKRFDLLVLALCLLVNLCEHCPENRTRLVHLDIPKRHAGHGQSGTAASGSISVAAVSDQDWEDDDDEEEDDPDDDENENDGESKGIPVKSHTRLTSALDELVQLFLRREEQARNHDFERDDDDDGAARRRREQLASAETSDNAVEQARLGRPTHIEEAGLKWRLIEDRKAIGFAHAGGLLSRRRRNNHKPTQHTHRYNRGDMDDDDESADRRQGDDDHGQDDEYEEASVNSNSDSEDDDEDDDESVGSGADVEFVADTQEEQERLAEQMSQAQRHMEDSVVAAYAALLLGCILQSSPRYADRIRAKLPDGQFRPLAIMLAKLLSFLSLTKGVGSSGSESILRIVRVLEAQDKKTANGELSIATGTTIAK
ncbi:hypothetical protein FGIG_01858 [Fasciola gigantica]|uniref:WAPL domain-containing protein n=1 Tax=Fasciola gigantica TaxID=46835 RepID=A0A504Y6N5_FASGI|nr:hypothetical protein FGIG_01858 [Fasciola gigantica]